MTDTTILSELEAIFDSLAVIAAKTEQIEFQHPSISCDELKTNIQNNVRTTKICMLALFHFNMAAAYTAKNPITPTAHLQACIDQAKELVKKQE